MEQSLTLLSAQVHFLDTKLVLIHIPLHLYTTFLQPILQLTLLAESSTPEIAEEPGGHDDVRSRRPWAYQHPFVNISITPVECSVVCSSALAKSLFEPIRDGLSDVLKSEVLIGNDEYVVVQVDGEGLDAGQRVLELTSPLAMNGISIFFITTYFSDYVLVPARSRTSVIKALEARGFAFSSSSEAFVNLGSPLLSPIHPTPHDTVGAPRNRNSSSSSTRPETDFNPFNSPQLISNEGFFSGDYQHPPQTPPPSSIVELEARTFSTLSRRGITPIVDPTLRLVQCAGRKETYRPRSAGQHDLPTSTSLRLQLGLIKCLISSPNPRFFSVTLTDTEPASVLLERRLLVNFGESASADEQNATQTNTDDVVLLGSKEHLLVPITLDLRTLPMENPGIVCGIAGRLFGGTATTGGASASAVGGVTDPSGSIEMSYLSTARSGTVMVAETELERALDALRRGHDVDTVEVSSPVDIA